MNKKPNEIERRWNQAKHYPPWAREYVRAGLLREGFKLIASTELTSKPTALRTIFLSVDIEEITAEQLNGIIVDLEAGIMFLDEIARVQGLIP